MPSDFACWNDYDEEYEDVPMIDHAAPERVGLSEVLAEALKAIESNSETGTL